MLCMIISLTKIRESYDNDDKIQVHLHGSNNKEEGGEQQGCEENHPWPGEYCHIENLNGVEVLTLFDAGEGIISIEQPPERKDNFGGCHSVILPLSPSTDQEPHRSRCEGSHWLAVRSQNQLRCPLQVFSLRHLATAHRRWRETPQCILRSQLSDFRCRICNDKTSTLKLIEFCCKPNYLCLPEHWTGWWVDAGENTTFNNGLCWGHPAQIQPVTNTKAIVYTSTNTSTSTNKGTTQTLLSTVVDRPKWFWPFAVYKGGGGGAGGHWQGTILCWWSL